MKTLVIYYSFTGNTEMIAEAIAKKIDGDLAEIVLTDSYRGTDEQINKQTEDEVKNKLTPEILPLKVSLDLYEMLHFIQKGFSPSLNDLKGKFVELIVFKNLLEE